MPLPAETPYTCVDPPVGEQLWRLEAPDLDPAFRMQLEAHLEACAACRQLRALAAATGRLAQRGALGEPRPGWRPQSARLMRGRLRRIAGLALAASLAGALMLPPRSVERGWLARGEDVDRFLRPAEGEVLATRHPHLRWTPIAGASGYRVEIRDPAGLSVWTGESEGAHLRLPGAAALAGGRDYRAILITRPADLLPPGKVSVSFRIDSPWRMAWHRLRWAHPLLQAAGAASLAAALLLSWRRRVQ